MFVAAEVWTIIRTEVGHAVLIRPLGSDRAVPIVIGAFEVQSIILGQSTIIGLKESINRPMTHDLMLHLAHILGGLVVQVEIHSLNEGIYYSNIILEQNGKRLVLDSRPSDAIALAIRARCPIYIEDSIVEEVGVETANFPQVENEDSSKVAPEEQNISELEDKSVFGMVEESDEESVEHDFEKGSQDVNNMTKAELESRLQFCVENELYEEAAKIRDLLKKFN